MHSQYLYTHKIHRDVMAVMRYREMVLQGRHPMAYINLAYFMNENQTVQI